MSALASAPRKAFGFLLFVFLFSSTVFAQEDDQAVLRERVQGLESLSRAKNDAALQAYAAVHLTETLRNGLPPDTLLAMLRTIGRASADAGDVFVSPAGDGMRLGFRGPLDLDVLFALEEAAPFRIDALSIAAVETGDASGASPVAPITWQNLRERLAEEAAAGFTGTVLVVRNGRTVLHEGYGLADARQGIPNGPETLYGIGSTPIDFTRAGILKLQDAGLLRLTDPITRFFPNVPPDKTAMTLAHLMTGQSGLPDFHHDPETDEDYDLTWISRDEAVRRILEARLLFAPGEDEAHSHSAFGLLAAVIEVVSNQSYPEFLKQHFFAPIGMRDTGFYGPDAGLPADRMAIGHGPALVGDPNIPLNWGPTSWLVMGSGGMVSNPGDMYRWIRAIHSDTLLSDEARKAYGRGQVYMGDSDRGFLFLYVDDPENTVLVSSNAFTREDDHEAIVARALVRLLLESRN